MKTKGEKHCGSSATSQGSRILPRRKLSETSSIKDGINHCIDVEVHRSLTGAGARFKSGPHLDRASCRSPDQPQDTKAEANPKTPRPKPTPTSPDQPQASIKAPGSKKSSAMMWHHGRNFANASCRRMFMRTPALHAKSRQTCESSARGACGGAEVVLVCPPRAHPARTHTRTYNTYTHAAYTHRCLHQIRVAISIIIIIIIIMIRDHHQHHHHHHHHLHHHRP